MIEKVMEKTINLKKLSCIQGMHFALYAQTISKATSNLEGQFEINVMKEGEGKF